LFYTKKKLKTGRNPQYVENLYVGKKNTDSAINEARENQVIYFKNSNLFKKEIFIFQLKLKETISTQISNNKQVKLNGEKMHAQL